MANICMNNIKIYSSSDNIQKLYDLLEDWRQRTFLDFVRKDDIVNLLYQDEIGAEAQTIEDIETKGYKLEDGKFYGGRAYIVDIFPPTEPNLQELSYMEISTDSAWEPDISVWKRVCDKFLGSYKYELLFESEEPGNNIFVTNDPDFIHCYYFEIFDDEYEEKFMEIGLESCMVYSLEQIEYSLRKLFNDTSNEKTVYDLLSLFKQKYSEISLLIKFEYGEIEDY